MSGKLITFRRNSSNSVYRVDFCKSNDFSWLWSTKFIQTSKFICHQYRIYLASGFGRLPFQKQDFSFLITRLISKGLDKHEKLRQLTKIYDFSCSSFEKRLKKKLSSFFVLFFFFYHYYFIFDARIKTQTEMFNSLKSR